nr:late histone H2B.L4-like [Marmota flaviventris]
MDETGRCHVKEINQTQYDNGRGRGKVLGRGSGEGTKRADSREGRRRKRCGDSFATYFPRVLKHIHSGLSLSRSSMSVLDSFVQDIFERITSEARCLAVQNHRSTITSRDIQTAVCLLLPGEIGKHAVYEATRAVSRSHSSK